MKKEHNYLGKKLIEIKEYKIIKQTYKIFIYHVINKIKLHSNQIPQKISP